MSSSREQASTFWCLIVITWWKILSISPDFIQTQLTTAVAYIKYDAWGLPVTDSTAQCIPSPTSLGRGSCHAIQTWGTEKELTLCVLTTLLTAKFSYGLAAQTKRKRWPKGFEDCENQARWAVPVGHRGLFSYAQVQNHWFCTRRPRHPDCASKCQALNVY